MLRSWNLRGHLKMRGFIRLRGGSTPIRWQAPVRKCGYGGRLPFVVLALSGVCANVVQAQDITAFCQENRIRYDIRFEPPSTFHVEARFPGNSGRFQFYHRSASDEPLGSAAFISEVRAATVSGVSIDAAYRGHGVWALPDSATESYERFSYSVDATHDRATWPIGKEEVAYRFDDAFYFTGYSFFLVDSDSRRNCEFDLVFTIPDDWTVVAPWKENSDNSFHAHSSTNLRWNAFVVGPALQPHRMRVKNAGIELVTLFENELEPLAAEVNALLSGALEAYTKIFGGTPVSQYVAYFGTDTITDGGSFEKSFGQRFAMPIKEHESIVWMQTLAHEVAHLWLGNAYEPDDHFNQEWFKEGTTDYLTTKTLYRIGVIDETDLETRLANYVRKYLIGRRFSGSEMTLTEAARNKQENRLLVYGAGSLFTLLLDAEMTAQQGPGSFEALLKRIYEGSAKPYSLERLMATLNDASDGAASGIYDMLNRDFDWIADYSGFGRRLELHGLLIAVWPPDEVYVDLRADGCGKNHRAGERCVPRFLRR